jgi:hypothetical protein
METALAIYEALIQAHVPPPAARRVAESLERDMTSNLATKQDLQHLEHLTKQDIQHLEQLMISRFDAVDVRVSLMLQNLESRIVVKLGVLITVLFGLAGAMLSVFR